MPRERGKRGALFSFTTLVLGVVYFLWKASNQDRDKKSKKHSAKWRAYEAEQAKKGKKKPPKRERKRGPHFILKPQYH
ncbi:hypothetical protein PRZ48_003578 [Zasmidium cellare]|uniref:Uncharacterized protein n=1 Tax=Zasmidium cellare TaxID=395010 RepID=A0ABR0EWH2_ZASCE|nr:hypothetical protein PRZ48_003578 [Zasmidium cellare]